MEASAKLATSISFLHDKVDVNHDVMTAEMQAKIDHLHAKIEQSHSTVWYFGVVVLVGVVLAVARICFKVVKGRRKSRYVD